MTHLLSPDNIQICGTPDLLPDVGEGVVAEKPDLLTVLDRSLAILERRQVLEGTIHPDAEERRLVRQVPVDVDCGRFLCGEPVVVVMLGLAYAPLLELVAVPMIGNNYRWEDENTDFFSHLSTLVFSNHSSCRQRVFSFRFPLMKSFRLSV